jgi:predicted small secreted protein
MLETDMRQMRCIIAVVIALCFINVPVFGQEQPTEIRKESTASEVSTADKEAANKTGSYLRTKKEQYQKKAEEKLHLFDKKVKQLYVRAEKKGIKARENISHAADELRKKGESAKNKLKDLKDSGEAKWENARAELDSMFKDLENSYNHVVAKFKD